MRSVPRALWDTGSIAGSPSFFEHDLPEGFHYRDKVITNAEERALLDTIAHITFSDFEMCGVVVRRRVAFFGQSYDRAPTAPFPAFLLPLRAALAEWAGVNADAFAMALINEYRPGSPIGWHRDAPQYDIVAGVSLLSAWPDEVPSLPSSRVDGRRLASAIGNP